jgi:FMN phosphatase YigB (HAD superfamily)
MHVAFDIGNVLVRFDPTKFTDQMIMLGLSEGDSMFFLEVIQCLQDMGHVTMRQALRMFYRNLSIDQVDELGKAWLATLEPNEMMLRYLDNLKSEGAKVAFLSNIGVEHAEWLKQKVPEIFDKSIEHLSYEVGARKPSKAYYQSFLMDHPEWTGSIYVDDRDENLKAGKRYSFKTFKFDLDQVLQLPRSKQKLELDKIKSYIFDRKYDGLK